MGFRRDTVFVRLISLGVIPTGNELPKVWSLETGSLSGDFRGVIAPSECDPLDVHDSWCRLLYIKGKREKDMSMVVGLHGGLVKVLAISSENSRILFSLGTCMPDGR